LNNMYQCGLNVEGEIQYPTTIEFFENKNVEQIAAGEHHSAFLLENGDVYTVGRGDAGQLGIGSLAVSSDTVEKKKEVEAKVEDLKDGEKANGTCKLSAHAFGFIMSKDTNTLYLYLVFKFLFLHCCQSFLAVYYSDVQ